MTELYLTHDGSLEVQGLVDRLPELRLIDVPWKQRELPPPRAKVGTYLPDDRLRELMTLAIEREWEVALLPHPEGLQSARSAGVGRDLHKALRHSLEVEAVDTDLLSCNGLVVFTSVVSGTVLSLKPYDAALKPSRWRLLLGALKTLGGLNFEPVFITTGKDQRFETAALGMIAVQRSQSSLVAQGFKEGFQMNDGRFNFLVVAPRSIVAFLGLLVRLLSLKKVSTARLPLSLGFIRSKRILVEATKAIDFSVDGVALSAKRMEFEILDKPLRLLPGEDFVSPGERIPDSGKDTVRTSALPPAETARQLVGKPLPLFKHASEADYRDLFVLLRADSALSSHFLVMLILSVLLALLGLYANSAPVIIGAMILAPLMAPITSLAMGLARTEVQLIKVASRTLAIGVAAALICAMFVAWLMPFETLTNEMRTRLVPNLLDLGVAVISGIAGAYASAKKEVAKSLAGVAIAVALVPPLSVAGIGLGWGEVGMAQGALLLFATNLVGIVLAAVLSFLVLGFAPFKLAKRGLLVTLAVLAAIVSPLYFSFMDLVVQGRIIDAIPSGTVEIAGKQIDLRVKRVRVSRAHRGERVLVHVVVASSEFLGMDDLDRLKEQIRKWTGRHVDLEADFRLRR